MPTRPRFEDRLEELLSDASTSVALLQMILLSLDRDPLDALADAEVLVDLLHHRFDALREAPPTAGKPASFSTSGRAWRPPGRVGISTQRPERLRASCVR